MAGLFNIGHIAQLHEIQSARLRRNQPGIGPEVEELIQRLRIGVAEVERSNLRLARTKLLWDRRLGKALKMNSFDEYLATIPEIPEALMTHDGRFHELVLVDARLGVVKLCKLLGVEFEGDDQTFQDFDPKKVRTEKVYWMRAQNGKKNRDRSVRACRSAFAPDELGLTVHEGLAYFAQNPEMFRHGDLDLPGSLYSGYPDSSACLRRLGARPALGWSLDCSESSPLSGSGSRME